MSNFELVRPLPNATFGGQVRHAGDAHSLVAAMEAERGVLPRALADAGGLLVVPGLEAMVDDPSCWCGCRASSARRSRTTATR